MRHIETAIATSAPTGDWQERVPSGDDLIFLYTGGTTGMPKGVMWRNEDIYAALWNIGRPGTEPPDPIAAARAGKRTGTCLPACPLMHGTGLFTALSTLSGGGTVVLLDEPGLDPGAVWDAVEREAVQVLTIVGDVFARVRYSLHSIMTLITGISRRCARSRHRASHGARTRRSGMLKHLPHVTLLDSLGSSEGMMTRSEATADDAVIKPARFAVNARVKVLDEHTGREVAPGSEEIGLVGVTGHIPLGYYNDPEKTRETFKLVGGVRYSIPGDYAMVDADGTIKLLGRGSACINSGGEKVYPEEIELMLRKHKGVFDCVVVGVPDARFGEMVVAIVQVTENHYLDEAELEAFCRSKLAGYKKPKRFLFVDSLDRSAAGKANYQVLRALAADRLGATE